MDEDTGLNPAAAYPRQEFDSLRFRMLPSKQLTIPDPFSDQHLLVTHQVWGMRTWFRRTLAADEHGMYKWEKIPKVDLPPIEKQ